MRRTAGLILAVSLVSANVWAPGKSDPCAAPKQACQAAIKADTDALAKLKEAIEKNKIAGSEYRIADQEWHLALDKWVACLDTGAACSAEAQAERQMRSRKSRAEREYREAAKQEDDARDAFHKTGDALCDACDKYAGCLHPSKV